MLVGRIVNDHCEESDVVRGTEKGHFEYGGSTIIVIVEPSRALLRSDIGNASLDGVEIPVKMGERVGRKI